MQVKRIVKQKLSQLEPTPGDRTVHKKEFQLNKVRLGTSHTPLHMLQHHKSAVLPGWRVGRDFVGRHGGVPYIAEVPLLQDALLAFSESAKIFITYITAAANDACKDSARQTLSEADVLTALEELDFGELLPPLKASLEGSCPARMPAPDK